MEEKTRQKINTQVGGILSKIMRWQLTNRTDTNELSEIQILQLLLANRGINNNSQKEFLNPQVNPGQIISSLHLPELDKAESLIKEAIKEQRPILVHGDYDVDGICATAIVWELLYHYLDYKLARPFIPHRTEHGYGISSASLKSIQTISQQLSPLPPLVITVDCGITAADKLEKLIKQGAQVIVTDHHLAPPHLPDVNALVHTTELSGTGLAWVLATRLLQEFNLEEDSFLDLVALATIGDLVPLLNHNRNLAAGGLKLLPYTTRPGLQQLYRLAGLAPQPFSPYHVSWIIAPRLNAPGRLGHALDSLRLLTTRNLSYAQQLAASIEQLNRQRQTITQDVLQQAETQVKSDKSQILVLSHKSWHEGIIGLIASRMVEKYAVPTIVIAEKPTVSKGSARSIKGFDLVKFLHQLSGQLVNFGGHSQAAGFSIETNKIVKFTKRARESAASTIINKPPQHKIDLQINLDKITPRLVRTLKMLQPHGIGNPHPLFLSRFVRVFKVRSVGNQNQHLKMTIQDNKLSKIAFSCIGFNMGQTSQQLSEGTLVDIVYQLDNNYYRGKNEIELKLKDLKLAEGAED